MNRNEFENVLEKAAAQRGCKVADLMFDDDDNVFEVVLDKDESPVDLEDCEFVHRAILAAFDRNVEDYSLTVGSKGMDSDQADEILKNL